MAKMQGARHAVCPSCLVPCGWTGLAFPVANWKNTWPSAHSHTPSGGPSISVARYLTSSRPGEICEFLGPPWKPFQEPPRKTPSETPRESHARLRTGNRLPRKKRTYMFTLVSELYIKFSELYIKWSRTIYKFLRTIYKISGKIPRFLGRLRRIPGQGLPQREKTPLNSNQFIDSTQNSFKNI